MEQVREISIRRVMATQLIWCHYPIILLVMFKILWRSPELSHLCSSKLSH